MTDNDIIKALGCCTFSSCSKCPYDKVSHCTEESTKDVIALINRQKAEIEAIRRVYSDVRAEAIKDFAERLKKGLKTLEFKGIKRTEYDDGYDDCLTAVEDMLNDTAKEMVGERE